MSDDEDMTDMSQALTQSGQTESQVLTSLSLSGREIEREPWGEILIFKIIRKRLGNTNLVNFQKQLLQKFGKRIEFA